MPTGTNETARRTFGALPPSSFPASEIVDGGFLDPVRFGIRAPDDPVIVRSVEVIDRMLKVETPYGPVWRRYNHDGYGQRDDGGPYAGWGLGRAWPLLTGERGHYELALGHDPGPYLAALERFATPTGLLTEQIWDSPDRLTLHYALGRPTEAAMPLVWAHAEYLSLLRSAHDGRVFDRIPEVAERYLSRRPPRPPLEVWKFNRRPRTLLPDARLRIIADQPFRLHASEDDWRTVTDLDPPGAPGRRWTFTLYWPAVDRWEGRDFTVDAAPPAA